MEGVVGNVDDAKFVAEEIQKASQTHNAQVVGSRRAPNEKKIPETDDVTAVHTSFPAHRAGLDAFQGFHEVLGDGGLFGDARRVSWRW